MTLGQLKKALQDTNLPDDTEVEIHTSDHTYDYWMNEHSVQIVTNTNDETKSIIIHGYIGA